MGDQSKIEWVIRMQEVSGKLTKREFIFEDKEIEYIVDEHGEVWFSADTIGRALEYKNPAHGINEIYRKHRRILDPYSRLIPISHITTTTTVTHSRHFSEEGVYIICMKSTMPRAVSFQIKVAKLIKDIRKQEKIVISKDQLELFRLKVREKELELQKIKWEKEKKLSNLLLEYAFNYPKQISAESQQALHAQALIVLSPESKDIIKQSLPSIEREYTATDISKELWREYKIEKTPQEIGYYAVTSGIQDNPELVRFVPNPFVHKNEKPGEGKGQARYTEYAKELIIRHYVQGLTTLEKFD